MKFISFSAPHPVSPRRYLINVDHVLAFRPMTDAGGETNQTRIWLAGTGTNVEATAPDFIIDVPFDELSAAIRSLTIPVVANSGEINPAS